MPEVFAVALASMHQDMARVDRVAQNLANATTPGYRREVTVSRSFADALASAAGVSQSARPEPVEGRAVGSTVPGKLSDAGAVGVLLDTRPGTLRITAQPLDLAIEGEGYFEVATDTGRAYTRAGAFQLDARGRLVTPQGFPVLGTDGEIVLTTRTPAIDPAGRITEPDAASGPARTPDAAVAQLRIVRFSENATLRNTGGGLLECDEPPDAIEQASVRVRQGALENANVSSAREMVHLMETVRHFETMQRVVQGYDELIATSIRKLGDLG
ncbi:MAG TPA: flagellar hook-basal body protein [Gemmatimonadaceae bacterium]|nr:flagellar hook-basal body protein [Gemmatimonadaceae bacterium]